MKKSFKRLAICLAVVAVSTASYSVVKAKHSQISLPTKEDGGDITKYPKCEGGGVYCCGNRETNGCNLSSC